MMLVAEPDHGVALGFGVMAPAVMGEVDRAREWTGRAMPLGPGNYNLMYNHEALKLLAPIVEAAQVQSLNWWKVDPDLDPLRGDARFRAMLEGAEARLGAAR